MVVFVQILTAVVLAAVLTVIVTVVFRRHRHTVDAVVFFFVIFLATWGGGLWLRPYGPSVYGVYWSSSSSYSCKEFVCSPYLAC
jgi:hypothetical protein